MASKRKRPADGCRGGGFCPAAAGDEASLLLPTCKRPVPVPSPSPLSTRNIVHRMHPDSDNYRAVERSVVAAAETSAAASSPAPLLRLLSARGILSMILLGPTRTMWDGGCTGTSIRDEDYGDCSACANSTMPMARMPAPALSQLLSSLYDEVKSGRNIDAVLRFVERLVRCRYNCCGEYSEIERHGHSNDGEGWVVCLAFMVAHDAVMGRLRRLQARDSITSRTENDDVQDGEDDDGVRRDVGKGGGDDIVEDDVVPTAMRIVQMVRCLGAVSANDGETVAAAAGQSLEGRDDGMVENRRFAIPSSASVVGRCFGPQLERLDSVVESLQRKKNGGGRNDDDSSQQMSGKGGTTVVAKAANYEKDWWAGVDLGSSDEEEYEEDEGADGVDRISDDGTKEGTAHDKTDAKTTPSTATAPNYVGSATNDEQQQPSALERAAEDLRSDLIENLPPGATSSDVQSFADRIASLIRRAGAELGASGVTTVGSILAYGGAAARQRTESALSEEEDAESESEGAMPFTDVLISALTKSCIDGGTSALRATAYIQSFVLPLVVGMGGPSGRSGKAAAASRVLTSTVTVLARDRPSECVEALLLPVLRGGAGLGAVAGGGAYEPSQAKCELVGRVIKSLTIPGDSVARLTGGIVLGNDAWPSTSAASVAAASGARRGGAGMAWTEFSMPIVTACLNKRPTLPDEAIVVLSSTIERHSSDMSKSMKFSTLFHTFVTKYGAQIQRAGCVDTLRKAAGTLKTFMAKTVTSALKKL